MEDPHSAVHRALYARIGALPGGEDAPDQLWSGLFTRPAVLAVREEESAGIPVRPLNRACRMMLADRFASTEDIARECGFEDPDEFDVLFRKATGWSPPDWMERFSRGGLPGTG